LRFLTSDTLEINIKLNMGASCCTEDQRPVLRIHLKRGEDIPAEDANGESDAYVIFNYGDLEHNRFEIKKSKAITTKGGNCTWNETIEFLFGMLFVQLNHSSCTQAFFFLRKIVVFFIFRNLKKKGGLESIQDVEIKLMDHDVLKNDDYSGKSYIFHGRDSRNPKNTATVHKKKVNKNEEAKYFLPLEWNVEQSYTIAIKNEEGLEAGRLHLTIVLVNHQAPIVTEEEKGLLHHEE
ncbi:hypothetical protein RFI_28055, partial [Reticulomyxa filosa]